MITKNKKNLIKIITAFFFSNVFFISAFANVDVTASLDSGTYNKVMKVELNTSEAGAKTFYGFNPDGTPGDMELYTGAILIKKSTPLVFFSFLTTTNESKIKINEYTINYSSDVKIGTGVFFDNGNINNLGLINNSADDVDISYWMMKNDSSNYTFPENSIIKAGGSYSVTGLNGTGTIVLFSPDEVKKDSVEVIIPAPVIEDNSNSGIATETPQNNVGNENLRSDPVIHKSTPKPTKIIHKIPTNNSVETPTVDVPKSETPVTETPVVGTPKTEDTNSAPTPAVTETTPTTTDNNIISPATSTDTSASFDNSLKNSVTETGNTGSNANYFIFGLLAFSIIGGISLKFINSKKSGS